MSLSRHAAAKELFLAALELPAAERMAFLERVAGGDPELRGEVEGLLAYASGGAPHEASGGGAAAPGGGARAAAAAATTPAATRFAAGSVFAGRYRIVAELGHGAMGRVYRAHDLLLDQEVALKLLRCGGGGGRVDRLVEEVRLARRVSHPNVCRVFDFGDAEGQTFLSMEYVDGEDLRSLLGRIGRLPAEKLYDLAGQLCAGLAAIHAQGILHRDLKPSNVMIDGRGRVRISDFGLATVAAGARPAELRGTPAYLAPEQWEQGRASPPSDLYALGLVLHEMASGEPVFRGASLADYERLHVATAPAVSDRLAELDPRFELVVLQCLEKDPRARPQSALEVAAALPGADRLELAVQAGETPSPELVAAAERPAPRPAGATAALALLLASLGALLALADRAFPGRAAWRDAPPEVLMARAGELLHGLGHRLRVVDRAGGFLLDPAAAEPGALLFWYRQAGDWMRPADLDLQDAEIRVSYYDPPPLEEGMVQMLLDPAGRLVTLKVPPAGFGGDTPAPPLGGEPDWALLRRASGMAAARETAPRVAPPFFADRRRAWEASGRPGASAALRLEAAALGSRVVFADLRQASADGAPPAGGRWATLLDWTYSGDLLLWTVLPLLALPLARTQLRGGRSDRLGARRVALLVAGVELARWAVGSDHLPLLEDELRRFAAATGRALVAAAVAWVAYVALEPLVRRAWPRTLVAWSRALRGRLADPQVGAGLLSGAAGGTGLALLTLLDRLVVRASGLVAAPEELLSWQLEAGLGARRWLASALATAVDGVYWAVLGLFLLALLGRVLGRATPALVAWVLLIGAYGLVEGAHPAVSWVTLGLGAALLEGWILVRGGLLTYAVALAIEGLLLGAPITLELASWYGEAGLFALASAAAAGLAGWWAIREASRPAASPRWEVSSV